ncbi:MAG: helix-turn-helix domain-containing protein, partial [Blastocatellia bacterium]
QLLIQVRVAEAVSALLQRPAALVEEVAQKVGFTEISNFGRQFKRRLGCAPKVLKKFFSSGPEESRFLHSRCSELVLDSLTVREITNKVHSGWFRSAINTCGERPDNSEIDWQESAVRARLQDGLAGLIHPTPS